MGANSKIEWTHHTFNPWWGCVKVSPGCQHCYAETFSKRTGNDVWGVDKPRRFFGDKHWAEPLKWNREAEKAGERRRVFCASMADVFEDRADLIEERARLWRLIAATPFLDWLLLTKRPENISRMVPWMASNGNPWCNVWLGTTVENQAQADKRIPALMSVPASIRFLSCEPLIGYTDLIANHYIGMGRMTEVDQDVLIGTQHHYASGINYAAFYPKIDWVIVGGESGAGAREMNPLWAKTIMDRCEMTRTPVFFKQTGAVLAREWNLVDQHKGGNLDELPLWAQVRQFPEAAQCPA